MGRLLQAAVNSLKANPVSGSRALSVSRSRPVKVIVRQCLSGKPIFDRARAAELHQSDLADLDTADQDIAETPVFASVRELALLELMTREPHDDAAVGLVIRGQGQCAIKHATA